MKFQRANLCWQGFERRLVGTPICAANHLSELCSVSLREAACKLHFPSLHFVEGACDNICYVIKIEHLAESVLAHDPKPRSPRHIGL
jgi:hypothetical protein